MKAIRWDEGQLPGWLPSSKVLFGSVIVKSAAGANTVKMAGLAAETNILGVADFSPIQKRVDGFYSPEEGTGLVERVPILPGGSKCRVWVTPNGTDTNIDNGDYLEVADLGSSPTGTHGMLEEAGSNAGETKTAISVAQALENCALGSNVYKVPARNVGIGDITITMTSGDITKMGLRGGDPVILEDLNGNVQTNRVRDLSDTVITLQFPSTVALTVTDGDLVTAPKQVLARLL